MKVKRRKMNKMSEFIGFLIIMGIGIITIIISLWFMFGFIHIIGIM